MALLPVTSTLAVPRKFAARPARTTKRSSIAWLNSETLLCRMTNASSTFGSTTNNNRNKKKRSLTGASLLITR